MKKILIITLLLVPFLNAEETLLICDNPQGSFYGTKVSELRFYLDADKQLIKSGGEYLKYKEDDKGKIRWREVTNYDDGSWISNSYAIDKFTGKLTIFTKTSPDIGKIPDSIWYECKKRKAIF
ncbi:hypothetical protein N9E26_01115 [bacterium]|nr:hypothetical protein [bacterium]